MTVRAVAIAVRLRIVANDIARRFKPWNPIAEDFVVTSARGMTTTAEDDYRRGFHDGELGRCAVRGTDSYAAGWRIGTTFARDVSEVPELTAPTPRTVDVADVLSELPREFRGGN
jgi:hypothetical protein